MTFHFVEVDTDPKRARQQLADWFSERERAIRKEILQGRRLGLPPVSQRWHTRWMMAANRADARRNRRLPARQFGNDYDAKMARKYNQVLAADLRHSMALQYGALAVRIVEGRITADDIAHIRATPDALHRDLPVPHKLLRKMVRFARAHDRVLRGSTFARGEGLNFP
jgi:hypothetical protein